MAGFDCTFLELDVIGDALQLDVRPFPFEFPYHGDLVEDRIRLAQAAERTLAAKGLIADNQLVLDLTETLGVFARGQLAIAMLGTIDGAGCCARAVTDHRTAVLAIQHGQRIRFDPITPPSIVRAILSLLPPARPGPGSSVTIIADVPEPTRRPTGDEDLSGRHYLQPARAPRDSAGVQRGMVDEIMRRPRLGSGYFVVTVRGRNARESEPLTMNWLDTDSGRYVVIPTTASDGRTHITYAPADLARLEQSLSHLVRSLT